MNYKPNKYKAIKELSIQNIYKIDSSSIVRKLKVIGFSISNNYLYLEIEDIKNYFAIKCNKTMVFGTESITAKEYFKRVIEKNDFIDVVIDGFKNGIFIISIFWIHIEYIGYRSSNFSKKDDGLFALRAKSGEKAERVVTKELINKYGHSFDNKLYNSTNTFQITYKGKKDRKPDRICQCCNISFEIKKRNKDNHFRISHSKNRTFESENSPNGWHAFVFPNMKIYYISNNRIINAINNRQHKQGSDKYDSWADVDFLKPENPPYV